MNWATRRQLLIFAGIGAVLFALAATVAVVLFYDAPTCTDGVWNQDEEGIDCGGSCQYVCAAATNPPSVRFARVFSPQDSRYDIIAYVDNKNSAHAAKNVSYTVELYDKDLFKVATKEGMIDIPPGRTVPVYVSEVYRGPALVTQAFLTIDDASVKWYEPKKEYLIPAVKNIETTNTATPRVRATLENPTPFPLYDIKPIATVFDASGNALAASQTFVPQIGGQSEVNILFTWNAPFSATPARVEVLPMLPVSFP